MPPQSLEVIERAVIHCTRCPELREYCRQVAKIRRKAFAHWDYWGRPVPGFGDRRAPIVIVGLAPAAHGANRTGRMFTGDRSGDFLYAALHRAEMANQPDAYSLHDGLKLTDVFITASLRCAPPDNKPTPEQLKRCAPFLAAELERLRPAVIIALGGIAWNSVLRVLGNAGHEIPRPRPPFAHGAECVVGEITLLGCYHVSQQNTFTGRLTEPMIDAILAQARAVVAASSKQQQATE